MDNVGLHSEPELGVSGAGEKPDKNKEAAELSFDLWKDLSSFKELEQKLKPAQESLEKLLDSLKAPADCCKPKPADWTIAINYTTDFGNGQGVDSGLKMLKEFAPKTKGKNITIVAQMAIADKAELSPEEQELAELFGEMPEEGGKYRLDRYLIRDGEIKKVSSKDSKGYGEDLKSLLAYASNRHPGKRFGLIIDSHGMGNEGLLGDTGEISVKDFVCKVKEGIKSSGREKLDLIEFDTCLMGANGAISKIKEVSENIVASAETEGINNGQNYLGPIERLLDKPETDGFSLARDIVVSTHKDMVRLKDEGKDSPVDTLAHFDMKNYNAFRKSLDAFGDELVKAIADPDNRSKIEEAIDSSRKYGSAGGLGLFTLILGGSSGERHRTDLKEFTEKVLLAIDNGEIKDENRLLKTAAQEVMNKRSTLVDSYHGMGDYLRNGGLSVFLPARSLRNLEKEAKLATTAGRLCQLTESKRFAEINKTAESRAEFIKSISKEIEGSKPRMLVLGVKGVEAELEDLSKKAEEFKAADSDQKREDSFKSLNQAANTLFNTEEFQAKYKAELKSRQDRASRVFKANMLEESSDGWTRFREKLRDGK